MMKIYNLAFLLFLPFVTFGQYTTPNSGEIYSLDELVTLSNGTVTGSNGNYQIHDSLFIAATDIFEITVNGTVSIAPGALITVEGGFNVFSNMLFTKLDPDSIYPGFRFESESAVNIEGPIFEYGGGLRALTGNFQMVDCIVRYQGRIVSTSGAVGLSTGTPLFSNSTFLENETSAIGSAANGQVAPTIINCTFTGNNTSNENRPQINLGPSGTDTTQILNNTVIGYPEHTMAGGIALASLFGGESHGVISGNEIRDNRYGITGLGNNLYTRISDNVIEDNNTQGDPFLGGSGININASAENGHIILDNEIRGNLWGITVQGNGMINMGDLENEEIGGGGNVFASNGNGGVTYALYNNTPNFVMAQENCWIEENQESTSAEIGEVIFDFADDETLGEVDYSQYLCGTTDPICDAPSDIMVEDITINSAQISWSAPATAPENGYEYYSSTESEEPTEPGIETDETALALGDLEENTTYYFWVRSVCADIYSEWTGPESFTTDMTSGISDVSLDQIASLYPNPTSGILNIDLSDKSAETIAIFDLSGRTLKRVRSSQTDHIKLNLNDYAAGVYIIQISGSNFIANGKFVIQ